ncbi:MAG: transposase, partial [Candidatus Methanomethylophilus sp.]|nr:transposase [Methanomethylophilus sp.]
ALRNKSENRSMTNGYNDASLGALIKRIKDKASSAGREIILVPPKDTSQLCSKCGSMVKKGLSIRVHECPDCGYTEDRDVNASRNVFQRALRLKIQGMGRPSLSRL